MYLKQLIEWNNEDLLDCKFFRKKPSMNECLEWIKADEYREKRLMYLYQIISPSSSSGKKEVLK